MKVTFFPCACISSNRVKFCVRMEGSTINKCVNMAAKANYYSIRRAREGSITTQKRAWFGLQLCLLSTQKEANFALSFNVLNVNRTGQSLRRWRRCDDGTITHSIKYGRVGNISPLQYDVWENLYVKFNKFSICSTVVNGYCFRCFIKSEGNAWKSRKLYPKHLLICLLFRLLSWQQHRAQIMSVSNIQQFEWVYMFYHHRQHLVVVSCLTMTGEWERWAITNLCCHCYIHYLLIELSSLLNTIELSYWKPFFAFYEIFVIHIILCEFIEFFRLSWIARLY